MRLRNWLAGVALTALVVVGTVVPAFADTEAPVAAPNLPIAPTKATAVTGIPDPCVARFPWPVEASGTHISNLMQKQYGIKLVGDGWTDPTYRPMVKIVWETLDAVGCTDYLDQVKAKVEGNLVISAAPTRSWAWADWSLTRPGALTFDFAKWTQALDEEDPGRLVRLVIHELGHAYNVDRYEDPDYWTSFQGLYARQGKFSGYGHNDMETYADVIGYYVSRCAKDNPFNESDFEGRNTAYYEWVKTFIFKGVEFGPHPGEPVDCSAS